VNAPHTWDLTPTDAVALQRDLARRTRLSPLPRPPRTVAGCDVSFAFRSPVHFAAAVVYDLETRTVLERVTVRRRVTFPYVPGLLSFREAPPLLDALARLTIRPDVVMLDGQGLAHPRRLGLACHVGLWIDRPTVGCAKTVLCGAHEVVGPEPGDAAPMTDRGEVVGTALRTKRRSRPLFVSPGHRIDAAGAVATVLATLAGYRMPEPTRLAHLAANEARIRDRTGHWKA
jgi:deoxyribonuclease V